MVFENQFLCITNGYYQKNEWIDNQWYSFDREIDYRLLDIEYLCDPKFWKKKKKKGITYEAPLWKKKAI